MPGLSIPEAMAVDDNGGALRFGARRTQTRRRSLWHRRARVSTASAQQKAEGRGEAARGLRGYHHAQSSPNVPLPVQAASTPRRHTTPTLGGSYFSGLGVAPANATILDAGSNRPPDVILRSRSIKRESLHFNARANGGMEGATVYFGDIVAVG